VSSFLLVPLMYGIKSFSNNPRAARCSPSCQRGHLSLSLLYIYIYKKKVTPECRLKPTMTADHSCYAHKKTDLVSIIDFSTPSTYRCSFLSKRSYKLRRGSILLPSPTLKTTNAGNLSCPILILLQRLQL
jgi:hypothetical protein